MSGFGLMYCGLSIEPGPTSSGLGPFQLYFGQVAKFFTELLPLDLVIE